MVPVVVGAAVLVLDHGRRVLRQPRHALLSGRGLPTQCRSLEGYALTCRRSLITLTVTLLLLAAGVWVGVGLGLSGIIGLTQVLGWDRAVDIVGKVVWEQNTSFVLVAIPMFIFMGEILFQSGIMSTVYLRAATVVSGIPGGLLQANIAACTIFAACSGSSVASAATIGSVGYPEIAKRGYSKPIALGSIAAGGTLGILIPPSIIFIVYGSLAEVSIGRLFLAGVVPGLVLAFALFALHCRALPRRSVARAARSPRQHWRAAQGAARALADGHPHRRRARRHLWRHRKPDRGRRARRVPVDPDRDRGAQVHAWRTLARGARDRAANQHDPVRDLHRQDPRR